MEDSLMVAEEEGTKMMEDEAEDENEDEEVLVKKGRV